MSLALALSNGLSGITASQGGLSTISQNVANANTVGYSRQVTKLEQQVLNGVGVGVAITGVERIVDEFLVRELRAQRSATGETEAVDSFFQQIQSRFGSPGSNLTISADLASLASALDTLANNPEDPALRFSVIAGANSLTRSISSLASTIQSLRGEADKQILGGINEVNALLLNINDLNKKIASAVVSGGSTAELKDERDRDLGALAELIDIKIFSRNNGEISILTTTGQTLLDADVQRLDYTPAATVSRTTVFGNITATPINAETGVTLGSAVNIVTGGTSSAVVSNIVSGRLDGLLDIRDNTLDNLAAQLDTLANAVRDQYNAAHNTGASFPAPNTLTGTRAVTSGDAFAATGTVRIAVVDGAGSIVGLPLDLDLGALGATTVGGLVTAINATLGANGTASVVNGKLQISASSLSNGIAVNELSSQVTGTTRAFSHYFGLNDLFVGTGSTDFAVRSDIVGNPGLIATAQLSQTSAVQSILVSDRTKTLDNAASFNVATDGSFTINGSAAANTVSFDVNVDTIDTLATKINALKLPGVTATVVSGGGNSARLVINSVDVLVKVQNISGGDLVAAAGFTAVAPTTTTGITIGDNRAVQSVAKVTESAFTFSAVGGLLAGSFTLGEYAGAITGLNAAQASEASDSAALQKDLLNTLDHRATSFSGVNVDEEMANMILFQNAFAASARMITATSEMFDTLINMV